MTLFTEKGTFTKTTSTGVPVSQQVNLVDSTLIPKVIWLWTSAQTTSNGTYTDHMSWSYGWSDTVNDVCQALRSHETNKNDAYVMRNDAIISILSLTAGSEISRADISAVAAGSFTLNWSVQSDTTAMVIHYMVAGGTDITNVSAFTSTTQNTSTGNHSWNGTGTTFTPDFAMTTTMQDVNLLAINTISAGAGNSQLSIGAATGTSNQWLFLAREEFGTTSDNDMYLHNAQCLGALNPTSGAFAYGGTFVSFNNSAGGGITVNITTAASQINPAGFLLIKGGKWDVKAFQQRSGTGTQDVTLTDVTVTPKLVHLVGINTATGNALVTNHYAGIGGGDGTREGNSWNGALNGTTTYTIARSTDTGKVYRNATPAATATASTTNAECDLTSISTAGQFTLDWTTADTTLRQMAYWMVGEVVAGAQFNRTASDTITVADASTTRILSAARVPSTDSSTVSDSSLTRMLSAARAPGSDTLNIADVSTTRSATRVRSTSTDSSTITDSSLTRILSATRSPPTDTLTIGETPTRMLSAIRAPTSDSTSVADVSTLQTKTLTRTGSDTTGVSDSSLTRLLSAIRVPSLDTVTVTAGTSTRMLSATRVPSLDTVATTEQVIGGKVYGRIPATDTITIADSALTRLLSALRSPSDTTPSSESLIRILSASRVPGSDTTTVADAGAPTRIRSLTRILTADVATVADSSLVRMLSATRAPSQDNIAISDVSITRLRSLLRLVTADTIATTENITTTQSQSLVRTASDNTAITDGTLSRFLSATRVPSLDTVAIADSSIVRRLSLVRLVGSETIASSESISSALTTAGAFSRSASDTVAIAEASLVRLLSSVRIPSTDTSAVSENAIRSVSRIRTPATDSTTIVDTSITRIRSLTRLPTQDTMNIVEASLIRLLSLARSLSDTTLVTEVQNAISHSRALTETVNVTEPLLQRRVSASRNVSDIVGVTEDLFIQSYHKFVFDTVVVSEQLFSIRQGLSGAVTYAIPSEVRPLLGNIGPTQRTDAQIELAIDAAYDEINTKTNRIPPNDWQETDHNFGLVKKLTRYIAAKECAIGIKDFDTKPLEMEIEHLFNDLLTYDTTSDATQDIVGSSPDVTYALNDAGLIWSVRYKNLRKGSAGENDTTINPNT